MGLRPAWTLLDAIAQGGIWPVTWTSYGQSLRVAGRGFHGCGGTPLRICRSRMVDRNGPERVTHRQRVSEPGHERYPCRDDEAAHPEAQRGELLPEPAGATAVAASELCWLRSSSPTWKWCIHEARGRSGERETTASSLAVSQTTSCRAKVRSWTWWSRKGFLDRPLDAGPLH